ncbi:MAG: alpha/beta fold hydrolase [Eubacteriales bacterium]|nr:alpha/beta fold hydrolase [Eubacteriales bacterium]
MAYMTTRDGQKLYYETWEIPAPRACIQILTGLGEMAWYYEEFAQEANRCGFSVWLHEYRKHGRSDAEYAEGNIFLGFAADAAQMLGMIRQAHPDLKVFLVCHSLGTGVGQFAAAVDRAVWDGMVMSGPSCRLLGANRFVDLLGMAETAIHREGLDAPSQDIYPQIFDGQNDEFAEESSPFSFITSDREKWDFIASLPFTSPDYSNRFFRDFVIMQGILLNVLALEKNPACRIPVLILSGELDVTTGHGTFAVNKANDLREAGFTDVTDKIYPGLRHSILQEVRRAEVAGDILSWISARV